VRGWLQSDHCRPDAVHLQPEGPTQTPRHWEGGKKNCAMFRMENQSELAGENVASLWRMKYRPCLTFKATRTCPPSVQDPATALAHWAWGEHALDWTVSPAPY